MTARSRVQAPGREPARPDERGSVLVVTADRTVRQRIQAALEPEGLAVETVAHGAAALRRLAQTRPHLVILDLRLVDRAGVDLADRLRRRYGAALPVVIVSANERALRTV